MSDIFDRINEITPRELESAGIITAARKSGYVCPACNNGTGDSGTGMNVIPNTNRFKCHKCQKPKESFSAVDLIMLRYGYNQSEMSKVAEKAKELFNVSDNTTFQRENKKVAAPMTAQAIKETPKKDYTEFYQLVQNQLAGFLEETGGKFRGLTYEDLKVVGAGIATSADLKSVGENIPAGAKCLILPFDKSRFYMRSISDNPKIKRGNTGGGKEKIYNPYDIDFADFYVVEGEIDAISIHKAGFDAVATSGAGEWQKLIDELKRRGVQTARIKIMFDNNDMGAGQQNAEKAIQALKAAGYMAAVSVILSPNEKYDANEFLQKDSAGLKRRLSEISRQAEREFNRIAAQEEKAEYGTVSVSNFFNFDFENEVNCSARYANRKTGFFNIDEMQILLPGLYLLGGIPSAGKSTLLWQLLEQLAKNGEKCIYCSYEMSPLEMMSKLVAREVYRRESENYTRIVGKALTAAEIRRGNFAGHNEFADVYTGFGQSEMDLHLMNLQDEDIDKLIERLRKICANTEKTVTICIDYLQFIPHEKENAKMGVDDIVRKLKVFQRKTNCTLFVISSLNRASYVDELALDSFKESGNLEFTADVVWGLQLYFDKDKNESRKKADLIDKKKKEIPRLIELKCLKNRNGANYTCYFRYLAHVDTFISCKEEELTPNSHRDIR